MTAHDETMPQSSATPQPGMAQPPVGATAEPVGRQQQLAQTQPIPSVQADRDASTGGPTASTGGAHTGGELFADEDRIGLRSRWDALQASFVDDPKQCVQQADGLVEEVVHRLTASFAEARSRLDEQWSQGHDPSTEDLRLALQRYRDFFHRLLTV
jgi:hypothetical protein